MTTPVVHIVFNRPRHTRASLAAIRVQRPSRLFIIADGPRLNDPTEVVRCEEVRSILDQIDWPCEVHRNYSAQNLGCRKRVVSGLDWVFSQVDRAIIIEDDCIPNGDFFRFSEDLLARYEGDEHVMLVTGNNFQDGRRRGSGAYYFSKFPHIWGWATWRRAWAKNDWTLSFWPEWKESLAWRRFMADRLERRYWEDIFDRMYRNEIDTWDFPWMASVWFHGGLVATPNANLVTNIGVGPDATHTVALEDQAGRPALALGPMTHPEHIVQDREADRYVFDSKFGGAQLRTNQVSLARRAAGRLFGVALRRNGASLLAACRGAMAGFRRSR